MVKALPSPDFKKGFPQKILVPISVRGVPTAFMFIYHWNYSYGFEANIAMQPAWVQASAFQANAFQTTAESYNPYYTEPEFVPLVCNVVRQADDAIVWIGVLSEYNPTEIRDPVTKELLFTF